MSALYQAISGIDLDAAKGIVTDRDKYGSFKVIDDLLRIRGIDLRSIENNRNKLTVQ